MFSVDNYLPRRFDMQSYNCWHMTVDAWKDLTGQELTSRQLGNFTELPAPRSPCIALMQRANEVPHVGVFYQGRILHLHPSMGGCFHIPSVASIGFTTLKYYLPRT